MTPEYREARIEHAERYLVEIRDLAVKFRTNEMYIKSLEEDAKSIGGIDYSRDLVTAGKNIDKLPNSVILLVEMKQKAEEYAEELETLKKDARKRLDEMDGTYGRLLLLYYVTALPWERVGEALNYSEDWCKHMRPDALNEFYDYLPHTAKMPDQKAI